MVPWPSLRTRICHDRCCSQWPVGGPGIYSPAGYILYFHKQQEGCVPILCNRSFKFSPCNNLLLVAQQRGTLVLARLRLGEWLSKVVDAQQLFAAPPHEADDLAG